MLPGRASAKPRFSFLWQRSRKRFSSHGPQRKRYIESGKTADGRNPLYTLIIRYLPTKLHRKKPILYNIYPYYFFITICLFPILSSLCGNAAKKDRFLPRKSTKASAPLFIVRFIFSARSSGMKRKTPHLQASIQHTCPQTGCDSTDIPCAHLIHDKMPRTRSP